MSAFTQIDLSTLPAPDVVEALSFDAIFSEMLSDLQARDPEFSALVESDPAFKILEVCAYRELIVRQRVNDAARAVMLAYAVGPDLDHIGALLGVARLVVTPADESPIPPVAAVMESDVAFRSRIQLSLEGFSVAGPRGAYIFHAVGADGDVLDASATSPAAGQVLVSVLSRTGNGAASAELLTKVSAALNSDSIRPLTDFLTVSSAGIVNYTIVASIHTFPGPDSASVMVAANDALDAYIEANHGIGRDVTLSGIYAALHQPGVQRVALTSPSANLTITDTQASYCTAKTITHAGTSE